MSKAPIIEKTSLMEKLETTTPLFLDLLGSGEEISTGNVVKKILARKINIRGIKHVLVLLQLFDL